MAHIAFPDERYKKPKLTAYADMEFETRSTDINNSSCYCKRSHFRYFAGYLTQVKLQSRIFLNQVLEFNLGIVTALKWSHEHLMKSYWLSISEKNSVPRSPVQVLWGEERAENGTTTKQSFVDLGCGNGLLVHILNNEGVGLLVHLLHCWITTPWTMCHSCKSPTQLP